MKEKKMRAMAIVLAALLISGCGVSGEGTTAASSTGTAAGTTGAASTAQEATGGTGNITKHTLAASVPLTGTMMQYGTSYKNAMEMAVADFNAAGGLNGEDVILEVYDDKGEQKEGINVANMIIGNEDTFAMIGSYGSSVSMAAAPVYQEAGMPMISPNTSHPDYPDMGSMMIPLACKSEVVFGEVAQKLFDQFGACNLAVIYQNTDVGITTLDAVKERFESLGGTVCAAETFVPNQTKDFTPLLSKIKATNPDILFLVAEYSDGASIVLQSKQLGMENVQLVGVGNVFKQEFLDLAGTKADGMLLMGISRIYTPEIMESSSFGTYTEDIVKRYNETYGANGIAFDNFAALAYDAAMVAMNAAKNAGTDNTEALVQEIKKLNIPLCAGDAHFDENGDLIREIFVFSVQDGTFVFEASK